LSASGGQRSRVKLLGKSDLGQLTLKVPTPCFDRPFSIDTAPHRRVSICARKAIKPAELTETAADRRLIAQIFPKDDGNILAQSLCKFQRIAAMGTRHHNHELITSETGYDIALAQLLATYSRNFHEGSVARLMSHLVIEAFEIVEIEDEHRCLIVISLKNAPTVVQCLDQLATVIEPRQRIRLA
jgi:hypothetical protein